MSKTFSRHVTKAVGAAATMLSAAAIAQAQVAAGTIRRDSVATHVVLLQGRMDSIAVIMSKIAQERYGSQAWVELTSQLDSFMANSLGKAMRGGFGSRTMTLRAIPIAKGWLGFNAQGPTLVISDSGGARRTRFLAYQPIISVDPGSPADHAGIEPGDVLVAYNGVDLIGHEFNLFDMIAPKKRVDVTVRRGGEMKDFALTAASLPEEVMRRRVDMDKAFRFEIPAQGTMVIGPDGERGFITRGDRIPGTMGARAGGGGDSPRPVAAAGRGTSPPTFEGTVRAPFPPQKVWFFSPNGLFGASLSNVSDELARTLKLRKGILVNDVPEDTPAYRGGLRSGDVIVAAGGDSVRTVGQLRDLLVTRVGDHSAELQVVRQQKVKKLTVSWPE